MTDYAFWLGDYGQDESPRVKVTYSNFDYFDCLPDEELCEVECAGDEYRPLPEERPSEYGPVEFDIADLGDE